MYPALALPQHHKAFNKLNSLKGSLLFTKERASSHLHSREILSSGKDKGQEWNGKREDS